MSGFSGRGLVEQSQSQPWGKVWTGFSVGGGGHEVIGDGAAGIVVKTTGDEAQRS